MDHKLVVLKQTSYNQELMSWRISFNKSKELIISFEILSPY